MNEDQQFSDGHEGGARRDLTQIEHQLRQWQPRAVPWNAATILHAAREDAKVSSRNPGVHEQRRRSAGWLQIGAAWLGGAFAGALLTFCLLHQETAPVETPTAEEVSEQSILAATAARQRDPSDSTAPTRPPDEVREADTGWARSQLLVSGQVMQLQRIPSASSHEVPLRAGSYVRLPTSRKPFWGKAPSARPADVPASAVSDGATADGVTPPAASLDRDRLLLELLGAPSDSLL